MSDHGVRRFFLVVVLLLSFGSPAPALEWRTGSVSCRVARGSNPAAYAAGSPRVAAMYADSGSVSKFLVGGGRTRVVQVCVVAMCIALFIMMRKLN